MRHDLVDCVQPRANDVTEVSPIRLGGIYRQSPTKGVTEENLLCLRIKSLLEKLLPKSNRGEGYGYCKVVKFRSDVQNGCKKI